MKILNHFVKKSLSVLRLGQNWIDRLLGSLADAARSISYVETVNPTQADTLHKEIGHSDVLWFKRSFEQCVRMVLKRLHLGKVKVGIDVTEDLFWGQSSSHTRASAHEHQLESWQYVNLAIVEPYFVPLMSLPYRQTDDLDTLVIELLEYLKTLPLHVELVLFDRGFYHWKLIDYLNGFRRGWSWPYLIFVPKNEAIKNFIEQTTGSFASYKHSTTYSRDQTTWYSNTRIVVLKAATKNKKGEPIDWCFATNQKAHLGFVFVYMKRWNIETGFRIHDEAKIKTKSTKQLIRYFYHLIGMLFILLWRIKRLTHPQLSFKRQLKLIEMSFCDGAQAPPWSMRWINKMGLV